MESLITTAVMPVVRHSLTVAAGSLVTKGWLDASMSDTFVGFGLAGVALALSVFNTVRLRKAPAVK